MSINNTLQNVMDKSVDWDGAIDRLRLEQQQIVDMVEPLSAWEPTVFNGEFHLKHLSSGQCYKPTRHCMHQMAAAAKCRQFDWLLDPPDRPAKGFEYTRDHRDADLMRKHVDTHMFQPDRMDHTKPRLFRTWADGTLRAFLSTQYATVNNMWYLNTMRELLPDARIIRWRGNADTLYFDAFLPDAKMVNEEGDSGYGGMFHCGNSEIGERRVICTPAILRFICTNGMFVWDEAADSIRQVHRGGLKLDMLRSRIVDQVKQAMPALEEGIDRVLGLKAYGVGDTPVPNLFAQLGQEFSFGRKEIRGIWEAWLNEGEIIGSDDIKTAFGLQAAITRYGQSVDDPERAIQFDRAGGRLTRYDEGEWNRFLMAAQNVSEKTLNRYAPEMAVAA